MNGVLLVAGWKDAFYRNDVVHAQVRWQHFNRLAASGNGCHGRHIRWRHTESIGRSSIQTISRRSRQRIRRRITACSRRTRNGTTGNSNGMRMRRHLSRNNSNTFGTCHLPQLDRITGVYGNTAGELSRATGPGKTYNFWVQSCRQRWSR